MNTQISTQNAQDQLAKLLATENINIIRGNVRTASFDIVNRRLILPRWKEMTPAIEEMLMLHEVGHALYTTKEVYGVVFEEKKYLRDYANVIEDVRIERKMKERYPGCRKSFNSGYRELNERDFFGVKNGDMSTLLLIDKINLYYKVGFNCGVKFNEAEYDFIRKADKCETEEDVINLAQEIFDFSKAEMLESKKKSGSVEFEEEPEDEFFLDDEDSESSMYDDYEEIDEDEVDTNKRNKRGSSSRPEKQNDENVNEEDLRSNTYNSFNDKVDQLADENLHIQYYDCDFEYTYDREVVIPYKKVIEELTSEISEAKKRNVQNFKNSNSQLVSYLVKEFEMKKSASAYKRAKVSKLGQLDSNKLYAYKLKDDLFKQIMQVKDGKKHGMIFLLDWSGSMFDYIDETIEQVINLAMFCQRIQIPYQVFAFTDGYGSSSEYYNNPNRKVNENGLSSNTHFNLLELFSNKMTNVEFNRMIERLLNRPYHRHEGYELQGTPLNEALIYMSSYVGKFIEQNQVEKMTFITLTDGEGGQLHSYSQRISSGFTYIDGKRLNAKSYIRDNITKKEYSIDTTSASHTSALLNIIRDRYNVNSVAFYLTRATYGNINSFVKHNMDASNKNQWPSLIEKIATGLRKDKFVILNNVPGRDEFYILNAKNRIEDKELEVDTDMSSSQLSRALGKVFNTKKNSRVVLNRFIQMVA